MRGVVVVELDMDMAAPDGTPFGEALRSITAAVKSQNERTPHVRVVQAYAAIKEDAERVIDASFGTLHGIPPRGE